MDAFDRYSLVLAMLEGDKEVHKILADLLEDSGDRGLAQWARSRKGKTRKRLDFILGVLPYPTTVLLACDFVEHLGTRLIRGPARRLIAAVRNVIQQEAVEDASGLLQPPAETPSRQAFFPGEQSLLLGDQCLFNLMLAGRCAVESMKCAVNQEPRKAAIAADQARLAARRVASFAQRATAAKATPRRPAPNEIQWQIEHVKQTLEGLVAGHAEA